jgi:hypothetical protein
MVAASVPAQPVLAVGLLACNVQLDYYVNMDLDNGPLPILMPLEPALILLQHFVVVSLDFNVLMDIIVN